MSKKKLALAVMLAALACILSCCGRQGMRTQQTESIGPEPLVNFKAIVLGNPPDTGLDEIYAQLDELTVPELHCTLRFEFIPWGDERKQLNIATASGEYDFIPGGVFSDYRVLVSKNAFLDLNDYLYLVPELVKHYSTYSENTLKDCEIDGGLYGIPQFGMGGIMEVNEGFFYREDLRKEWGLAQITDLDSMEAYLYRAKQDDRYRDEALITDNRIWQSLWLMVTGGKYLEVNSMMETPFVVVEAEEPYRLVNRLETPEFAKVLYYINKWRKDGILESDLLALSDNEGARGKSLMMADRKPCETNVPDWSAGSSHVPDLAEAHPEWEYGFFPYTSGSEEWYIASLAGASVVSISSKTQDPEKAIRLLEKIHTDQRYYDLVRYGVEGIHFKKVGENISYDGIPGSRRFSWTVCSDDLLSYEAVPANEQWHRDVEVKLGEWKEGLAKIALPHPLDGFNIRTGGIEKELAQMDTARLQYFQPLVCGYYDSIEDGIAQTKEALEQAGLTAFMENLQEQLLAWEKEKRAGK